MADEYIKRKAAKQAIFEQSHFMTLAEETHGGYGTVLWGKNIVQEEMAMNALNAIPAADVRPVVRGRWVRSEDADDGYCSNCKCDMPMCREDWEWKYCETDFCPNCGADMREVQDG